MTVPETTTNLVRIDEFKAARRVRLHAGAIENEGEGVTCGPAMRQCPPAPGPRSLTPQEISHRFVMLAFLRQAR